MRCPPLPRLRSATSDIKKLVGAVRQKLPASGNKVIVAVYPPKRLVLRNALRDQMTSLDLFAFEIRRGLLSTDVHQRNQNGGPNGIRTRVSALRGPCPGPL